MQIAIGTRFAYQALKLAAPNEKKCAVPIIPTGGKTMTTTAIALFGTRVSPRFDCAHDFMLITTTDNTVTEQHTETIRELMPILKVRRLAALRVSTLICGGIEESSRALLLSLGITVIANMKGQATDAVTSYLTGPDLVSPA